MVQEVLHLKVVVIAEKVLFCIGNVVVGGKNVQVEEVDSAIVIKKA